MRRRSPPSPPIDTSQDRLCTPEETAQILALEVKTLTNWRVTGRGPRALSLSARCVRYRYRDILAWIQSLEL